MKETRVLMGMPVVLDIVGADKKDLEEIFSYLDSIDKRFSTYRPDSEISRINRGEIERSDFSDAIREVFDLSEKTKQETNGYFDIKTPEGKIDPSGLVKGWAIKRAADLVRQQGHENFWVEAGGDIQVSGVNSSGAIWRIGIRNPFDRNGVVKVVALSDKGIATSGDYIRGAHIYDPLEQKPALSALASITVIGPDVYEADRFATAAYAMGEKGIRFIESLPGLEGYAITRDRNATETSGFSGYITE